MSGVTYSIATASNPGAIGIVQLYGPGVATVIEQLTEQLNSRVPTGPRSFLADLGGIDEGLVVILRDNWAQLMPHGGPRVMQRLTEKLRELGASPAIDPPAQVVYPEASSELEADMLAALAKAASPAAIDLLLEQPRTWRAWLQSDQDWATPLPGGDPRRHLVDPPSVVLVGQANVGKSTLSNLVLGRTASITADLPGTTRDWVAGLAELPTPIGELAVRWIDTPGMRETDDPIERRAIELARSVVEGADVLIAVRDPMIDWAELPGVRLADIRVMNKCDLPQAGQSAGKVPGGVLRVSALTGEGLNELGAAVAGALGLCGTDEARRSILCHETGDTVSDAPPWAFSDKLRRLVDTQDRDGLFRYTAPLSPEAGS